MSGNYFCHICGGLVDLIKLQPSGVDFCNCKKQFSKLRAEINEQARLLGISAEKELALRAENERLKAELAEAKKDAERYREWKYRFREGECELFNALADCATDEEHDAAIDAAMKGK